jgi:hypothetical protein
MMWTSLFLCKHRALLLFSVLCGLWLSGCSCGDGVVAPGTLLLQTDLSNNQLVFSNVPVGQRQQKTFRLYSRSLGPITVSKLEIREELKGAFRVVKSPKLPFTLDPSSNSGVFITIEYNSLAEKAVQGLLLLRSDNADNVDANGNFRVTLRHLLQRSSPDWSCGGRLNFGLLRRGTNKTLRCTLRNTAGDPLTLTGVRFVPDGAVRGDFRLKSDTFPITLPPDGRTTAEFEVVWTPEPVSVEEKGRFVFQTKQAVTTRTRTLELAVQVKMASARMAVTPLYGACVSNADCETLDTRLRCTALDWRKGSFCVPKAGQPPFLNFPWTPENRTSSMAVAIRSVGELPLKVTGVELGDKGSPEFSLSPLSSPLPWELKKDSVQVVTIVYRPTDLKPDQRLLWIRSNDDGQPNQKVALEAGALGCRLEIKPLSLTFFRDKRKSISLKNTGTGRCLLSEVRLQTGGGKPFSLAEVYKGTTLEPQQKRELQVFFDPSRKDVSTDRLLIRSNDPRRPLAQIALKVGDPLLECQPRLLPTRGLDFGQARQGTSRALPLRLLNNGEGNCVVNSAVFSMRTPAGVKVFRFQKAPSFPVTIGSGETKSWMVEFAPIQGHSYFEGTLIVRTSSIKTPLLLAELRGSEASRACLQILPSQVNFGTTQRKCSSPPKEVELFFVIDEKCPASIEVSNASLGIGSSSDFVVSSKVMLPVTLRQGDSLKLQISYKPLDLGGDRGSMVVETSYPAQKRVVVPLVADSNAFSEHTDTFIVPAKTKVDVLFVVDDSSSMADRQANLARNFQAFIQWASGLKNDFHIGIASTDTSGRRFAPGCLRGTPRVLTDKTPSLTKVFERNVKLGTIGSGNEKGLEAAYQALSAARLSEFKCNQGFLRKDAGLSLIFVSDEQDNSPQSVDFYIRFFRNLKKGTEWVRASAIVGPPPSGCKAGKQFAQSAPRYWKVAKVFGGIQSSICRDDWSRALSNIGIVTLGARSEWVLSRPAIEASLLVKVNGKTIPKSVTDGWSYAADLNSIVFSNNRVPPVNSKIEISYKVQCLP